MPKVTISKMTADDLDRVYEIDKEAFPIPWQKTSFEDELKNILATYFIAKIDDKIVRISRNVVYYGRMSYYKYSSKS